VRQYQILFDPKENLLDWKEPTKKVKIRRSEKKILRHSYFFESFDYEKIKSIEILEGLSSVKILERKSEKKKKRKHQTKKLNERQLTILKNIVQSTGSIQKHLNFEDIISFGGEAVVFKEKILGTSYAVRVQPYDSLMFVEQPQEYLMTVNGNMNNFPGIVPMNVYIFIYHPRDFLKRDALASVTIMPLFDDNLKNLLKDNVQLPMKSRSDILNRIFVGLAGLQKLGIRYSDLKPTNILLKKDLRKSLIILREFSSLFMF